jgi:hypothetical protein
MKICFLSSESIYDGAATANRVLSFANELYDRVVVEAVSIVCPRGSFRDDSFPLGLSVGEVGKQAVRKKNLLLRAADEIRLSYQLWNHRYTIDADIVLITIPSIFLLLPLLQQHSSKKVIVIDVRDAVWTYLSGSLVRRFAAYCFKVLFVRAAKVADKVSITNQSEAAEVSFLTGIEPLLVPNGISKNRFEELSKISIAYQPPDKNKIALGYLGNVGVAQKLDQLLDWVKHIKMLDVYIIGDGAELPGLQLKCRNETITNVNFIDRVNFAQLKLHITALDILFAQIGEDYATAIPSKIFEYIAAGRKILLGLPEGPAQDLFGRFAGVYIFAAEDRASFNEALSKCID